MREPDDPSIRPSLGPSGPASPGASPDEGEPPRRRRRRRRRFWRQVYSVAFSTALLVALLVTRKSCANGTARILDQAFPTGAGPDAGLASSAAVGRSARAPSRAAGGAASLPAGFQPWSKDARPPVVPKGFTVEPGPGDR